MNIVLFEQSEVTAPLSRQDPRARHVLDVLRCEPGDRFDAGLVDGPRGKALVEEATDSHLRLSFVWGPAPAPPEPLTLVVGMCRPQTMRRILREAAALGVARMLFPRSERGEATYADSSLWSSGEFRRHVRDGVEQAFSTQIPAIAHGMSLTEAVDAATGDLRLGLDNYEAQGPLHGVEVSAGSSVSLAIGSERGWSGDERLLLRDAGYRLVGLGPRVLRTEVAVTAALSLVKAASGSWDAGPTPDSRVE